MGVEITGTPASGMKFSCVGKCRGKGEGRLAESFRWEKGVCVVVGISKQTPLEQEVQDWRYG
jgi:hypothetical protein